jgi:RNA polymerase-binding transcription factor DksA
MTEKKSTPRKVKTTKKKSPWPKKDLKMFEERLLEEREKAMKELGLFGKNFSNTQRDSSGDLSSYAFHMADLGTDAMEREKAFLFASQEGRLLYHIDEALRRLYKAEEYGICEYCSQKMDRRRLSAIPHARLCIECKEKEENANQ